MRRTELKRKPMKRSQPRRDWRHAREKVEREEMCRIRFIDGAGDCEGRLEAAHIIGRACDFVELPGDHTIAITGAAIVAPVRVIPLCSKHHRLYDAHELDILHTLTTAEQVQAVLDAGSIETARVRTCPSQYRREAA